MIQNPLFYCKNKDTYPPFKNGYYMEEHFMNYISQNNVKTKRKYIPALWTNFQIEPWFKIKKNEMQNALNTWVSENQCDEGYYTIVQYDDGPLLELPPNTIIYGACSGHIPLPLIYEDRKHTLETFKKKQFSDKKILCSFVGNITSNYVQPNVRNALFQKFLNNKHFVMINSGGWTANVQVDKQQLFIDTTINSKFALAPRGYGRSSFRFFECFQLGTIPVYVWNDQEWLPYKNIIDYNKFCISIHVSQLNELCDILLSIDKNQYMKMFEEYNKIKHIFTLNGMSQFIISNVNG